MGDEVHTRYSAHVTSLPLVLQAPKAAKCPLCQPTLHSPPWDTWKPTQGAHSVPAGLRWLIFMPMYTVGGNQGISANQTKQPQRHTAVPLANALPLLLFPLLLIIIPQGRHNRWCGPSYACNKQCIKESKHLAQDYITSPCNQDERPG